jgi:hypothetical protein
MEKLKTILIFILFLMQSHKVVAAIHEVNSLEEINKTVLEILENRNPEKTLFLLPLEKFLIQPSHPFFSPPDSSYQSILARVLKKVKFSQAAYLEELLLTAYENELTDPKLPEFIHNLQKHQAPIIIVTSNVTGGFNNIDFLEVWTVAYLTKKNIDLTKSRFADKQILFNKELAKIMGTYPSFYRGLLSCNSYQGKNSAQAVISALLGEKLKWLPNTVVAVHPETNYLESLESQLKTLKSDLDFIGFAYRPSMKTSSAGSPEKFQQFWEQFVRNLNNVTRKKVKIDLENPYEQ